MVRWIVTIVVRVDFWCQQRFFLGGGSRAGDGIHA